MAALEEDLGASAVAARHFDAALLRVKPSSAAGSALMATYLQFQRHSAGGGGGPVAAEEPPLMASESAASFCIDANGV